MTDIDAISGFDKELEVRILQRGVPMEYLPDALVYDEKVANAAVFKKKRTRWIAAQLNYLRKYFFVGLRSLFVKGNVDFFNKTLQFTFVPRLILLGLLAVSMLFFLVLKMWAWAFVFFILLDLKVVALLLAAPANLLKQLSIKDLAKIPLLFVKFVQSIFNIKKAQKKFLHTPHGED